MSDHIISWMVNHERLMHILLYSDALVLAGVAGATGSDAQLDYFVLGVFAAGLVWLANAFHEAGRRARDENL